MNGQLRQSVADLNAELLPDGRLLVRSRSMGIGAKMPVFAMAILSYCASAKKRADILSEMGPQAASLSDQLFELGLLRNPSDTTAEVMFHNFAGINVHRRMLSDKIRLMAYKKAIEEAVKPGDIVIDAGAGSGILSLYAAQAGAKAVYAIEASEMADELTQTAANNDLSQTIIPIQGNFGSVKLPEKADLLITETFGSWALAEGAAADLKTCIQNNLKPNGRLLPEEISLKAAPIECLPTEMLEPFVERWDEIDLSSHAELVKKRSYNALVPPESLCGNPREMARLTLKENVFESTLTVNSEAKGLALWFELIFSSQHSLKTSPFDPPTHWKQTCIAIDLQPGTYAVRGQVCSEGKRAYALHINETERIIR